MGRRWIREKLIICFKMMFKIKNNGNLVKIRTYEKNFLQHFGFKIHKKKM